MRQVDSYELWFVIQYELRRLRPSHWRDMVAKDRDKRDRSIASAAAQIMMRAGKWLFFEYVGAEVSEVDADRIAGILQRELSSCGSPTLIALARAGGDRSPMLQSIADRILVALSELEVLVQEPGKSSAGVPVQDHPEMLAMVPAAWRARD